MPDASWFTQARFGLFVHFGLYSTAARHEWVQTYEQLTPEQYQPYFDHFEPDRFDASDIAATARRAGAGYVVLTTKHHEGFSLWDTSLSDFSAPAACGRDLVAEFVAAVRAAGLRVGFYHSLLDWHHPEFPIDGLHPLRNAPGAAGLNRTRELARYREFLHGQVRELLTGYGQIDYLFFDYTYPEPTEGWPGKSAEDWDATGLLALCRELQPRMLINDRLGVPADFVTPEQYQPSAPLVREGRPVTWEACQTMNGSWGYHRDNLDYKPSSQLLQMLAESVSCDGNMLLNIGPDGRGAITGRDRATLTEIGDWMELHSGAIRGAGAAGLTPPREGVYTRRGDRLYLHLLRWPLGFVHCPGLAGRVSYTRLLHDGSWLRTSVADPEQPASHLIPASQPDGTLTVHLPVPRPAVALPVIEFTLR